MIFWILRIGCLMPLLVQIGCNNHRPHRADMATTTHVNKVTTAIDYGKRKQSVAALKAAYQQKWPQLNSISKQRLFVQLLADSILPCWMGTPWNFYGTTETPNRGSIACGYFVTTALRDVGLPLQRVKLAQCASEEMIRQLVKPNHIQRFSNTPLPDFLAAIKQQGYGLYIGT